jgi:uncharacterized protein with FMN-binding domain
MAKKMPRRLVALSGSAIAAIYLAGSLTTAAVHASVPSASTTSALLTSAAPSTTATSLSLMADAGATYADGTYAGTGTSRFGNVSVSLTVQSGKIAGVTISRSTTSYPVSRIAGLPAQVVARQSAQVDRVSGATYSTQAFKQAVQQALTQAQLA